MGFWYDKALQKRDKGQIDFSADDLRILLVGTSTTVDTERDTEFISGFSTLDELTSVTNYSRKTLTSLAVSVDITNHESEIDADDVVWSSLGGTTDATIQAAVIYKHVTDDTDAIPLIYLDNGGASFNQTTNGGDVTINFAAEGYAKSGTC